METKELTKVNGVEKQISDPRILRTNFIQSKDKWRLDAADGCFYLGEFGDTRWFFEFIISYQHSSALQGANLQTWSIHKLNQGLLQIVCKDSQGDILLAKLLRKKFPLSELTVVFQNHLNYSDREIYNCN
jgi:hypothetical protein